MGVNFAGVYFNFIPDIFLLQQDVINRKAALHVYFLATISVSGTSVSINSTTGRPSGWALPRILVRLSITSAINGATYSTY